MVWQKLSDFVQKRKKPLLQWQPALPEFLRRDLIHEIEPHQVNRMPSALRRSLSVSP